VGQGIDIMMIRDLVVVIYFYILVDNAAFQLIKNPAQFKGVMLLENMQGDILTGRAGGILGSLGLMPSACMGPDKGYVEPAHGSAPDIAGKGIANPIGTILSVKLMFEESFNSPEIGNEIDNAVEAALQEGRTLDLKSKSLKTLSTIEMGDLIAIKLKNSLKA